MKTTTRIKIFIKKYLPNFIFKTITFIYSITFVKLYALYFTFRTIGFTKEKIAHLNYFGIPFSLIINPHNGYFDKWIYLYNSYEAHVLKEIKNHVHSGDIVLDIGANIGHHSLFMSKLVGDEGHVISFEPINHIRNQFERSIKLNHIQNILVKPLALGEKESVETIFINEDSIASSSIVINIQNGKTETINVVTLDLLNLSPSFMKIDVEGYEYFVLLGAEKTISGNLSVILIEYSPVYYRKNNTSHTTDIISFLRKHNYEIYDIENNMKKITNDEKFIKSFSDGMRSQTNLICIPKH